MSNDLRPILSAAPNPVIASIEYSIKKPSMSSWTIPYSIKFTHRDPSYIGQCIQNKQPFKIIKPDLLFITFAYLHEEYRKGTDISIATYTIAEDGSRDCQCYAFTKSADGNSFRAERIGHGQSSTHFMDIKRAERPTPRGDPDPDTIWGAFDKYPGGRPSEMALEYLAQEREATLARLSRLRDRSKQPDQPTPPPLMSQSYQPNQPTETLPSFESLFGEYPGPSNFGRR